MDDRLEQPKHFPNLNTSGTGDGDHEQDSSGDEDGGLDWTKLPYVHTHPKLDYFANWFCLIALSGFSMGNAPARPVILKRGEKDFEPAHGGGSGLQRHNLELARSAMFDALRSTRTISRCVHPPIPRNTPHPPPPLNARAASPSATQSGTQILPARM